MIRTERSIIDHLERGAAAHPGRRLYTFQDGDGREREAYSYQGFHERTIVLAQHLCASQGLRRGDRVLLVYQPGLEIVVALVACARIGVIPVPVYPPTPMNFEAGLVKLMRIADDCRPVAALTTRAFLRSLKPRFPAYAPSLSTRPWITTDDASGAAPAGFENNPDPILLLQYTSGSTSDPRGVVVSHHNVIHNCGGAMDGPPTAVSWLPQHHDMGLIGGYLFALVAGGSTCGFSPLDFLKRPALWLRTISRTRATHTAAPNFAYEYCLREDKLPASDLADVDLSSLRVMMNAAEPVRPETCRRFRDRFAPFGLRPESLSAAYGLAENTLAVTRSGLRSVTVNKVLLQQQTVHVEDPRRLNNNQIDLMSCGTPISGVDLQIVDPATHRAVGDGRIGEIWTAGASTCRGYWNRPDDGDDVFGAALAGHPVDRGVYLRTGDLGFLHEGELFVCGRIKDLIIIRGVNFYPQDIEAIVESSTERIRPDGVVAFDAGKDAGQLIVIVEARRTADPPDLAQIARAIRRQYFVEPHTVALVRHGAIPRTTSGKHARREACRRWQAGDMEVIASLVKAPEPGRHLQEPGLRPRFQYILDLYDLTGDEAYSFADLGVDSLTTVELLADIKSALEARGCGSLVREVDARWLHRLTIAEFFALIDRFEQVPTDSEAALRLVLDRVTGERERLELDRMRSDAVLPDLARVEVGEVEAPGSGILLTGATGFFGPFLLGSLLRQTVSDIHVLTRATGPAHGRNRIRAALERAGEWTPALSKDFDARVRVVCGDLGQPNLGLPSEEWRSLATRIEAVCHNGALVNYMQSYEALRAPNVEGTRELIRFAHAGVRKVFHFVSSTFVYGWSAKGTLWETDHNAAMADLDFGYAQSKWVAEQLVHAAGRQGLDVRVYRPSLISASSNGVGSRDDIGVRLLAFMITHGIAPEAANQISFLPADVAAHNIAALVSQPGHAGRTFNVTVDDYYNIVDVAHEITRAHGYPFTFYPVAAFVAELNRRSTRHDPVFPLVDFFNRSHPKISAMQHKRYNNDRYRDARDRSGSGWPDPRLAKTVAYLVAFMRQGGLIPSHPVVAR